MNAFRSPLPVLVLSLLSGASLAVAQGGLPGEVLSAQKISSTQGGFGGPLANEAMFGSAIANIGDVDGDGIADLAVGTPSDDQGGPNRGALWIVPMSSDGTALSWHKISDTEGFFEGDLRDQDHFGASVAGLGDLDGDGLLEIAVGAPGDDGAGLNRGSVYVLSLASDGRVVRFVELGAQGGGFTGGLSDQDAFGASLTAVGDLNGDGVTELAVGASGDDDGGPSRGAVWILFLAPQGTSEGHQKISDIVGSFEGLLLDFDQFGNSVTTVGLLNADAVPDLAVGAFGDDDGGPSHGAVWILFLAPDGTVTSFQKISSTSGGFEGQIENGDAFGVSVVGIEDIDGNLGNDLAVGVLRDSDGGPQRGAVWVLYLDPSGSVRGQAKISDTSGGFGGGLDDFDHFGFALASTGDLDEDGNTDLFVGAPGDDDGGTDRGALYALFLQGHFQAAFEPRPGSPQSTNPDCAVVLNGPEIDHGWMVLATAGAGGTLTALIGQSEPLSTPIQLGFGELLIDLFSTTLYVDTSGNGSHTIPVPNQPALVGFVIYSQALRLGPPIQLCNAWDATIGY